MGSLVHLPLLLPIKEYSEGPVEIHGRSAICTRKVLRVYVESPLLCTRKVFGFCKVSQGFVGNFRISRRGCVRGRSTDSIPRPATPKRSRFATYPEGPNRAEVYAEGLVWPFGVTVNTIGPDLYAEGPGWWPFAESDC
jgi:hypothetical protein